MKTATVADLRNHFSDISSLIHKGEKITITKRGLPFAILSPLQKRKSHSMEWPDRAEWRKRVFPEAPSSTDAALEFDRGDT
jgi:antitoxin (DNA-binding transcriptional repressor) of toxin-antitoxin stability system